MIWSARPSTEGGIVRPSALAGGLEVDDQLELRGLLDGQLADPH